METAPEQSANSTDSGPLLPAGLQLLRVKRRRHDAAPQQLIVHSGPLSEAKRARTSGGGAALDSAQRPADAVAVQLGSGLMLQDMDTGTAAEGGEQEVAEDRPTRTVRRYIRVQTLARHSLQTMSADDAIQLIKQWKQSAQAQQPSADVSPPSAVQYTVVGQKRLASVEGSNALKGSEGTSGLCRVIDIHAEPLHPAAALLQPALDPSGGKRARVDEAGASRTAPGVRAPTHVASGQEVEARLQAVFLPMLDDYLRGMGADIHTVLDASIPGTHASTGADPSATATASALAASKSPAYKQPSRRPRAAPAPAPGSSAGMGRTDVAPPALVVHSSGDNPAGSAVLPGRQHVQSEQPAAAPAGDPGANGQPPGGPEDALMGGESEEEGDELYAYDVYIPVGEDEEERLETIAMETDSQGYGGSTGPGFAHIPVIHVPDEDDALFWLSLEQPGGGEGWAGGVDHDSEDSNAESYYANSYPDEDPWAQEGGSEEAEESSEASWGGGRRPKPSRGYSGRAAGTTADDEEYDLNEYDSYEEGNEQLDDVARSRKIAQAMLRNALSLHRDKAATAGSGAAPAPR